MLACVFGHRMLFDAIAPSRIDFGGQTGHDYFLERSYLHMTSVRRGSVCRAAIAGLLITGALLLSAVAAPTSAMGHSGRTDSSGGHNDNINGGYHYHNGPPASSAPAGGSDSGGSGSSGSSNRPTGGSGEFPCLPILLVGGVVVGLVALNKA